jgi:rare lipoprotein A
MWAITGQAPLPHGICNRVTTDGVVSARHLHVCSWHAGSDSLAHPGGADRDGLRHRAPASRPPAPRPDAPAQTGEASWYGPQHHGKRTASGEVYDMNKLTAAHRTLPLGTRVRVTNIENGRSVDVRINDRGPFVDGRVIDLSRAAAERLGALGEGVVRVSLKVISDSASD